MKTNFQLVSEMHRKFNLSEFFKGPRLLSREEYQFRVVAMFEELFEYVEAVYDTRNSVTTRQLMNAVKSITCPKNGFPLKENPCLEDQFDALLDLAVFTLGTADRQNFPWDNGFERVMESNMTKELGQNGDKRGGFKRDLVKPKNWKPPVLTDLIQAQAQVAMNKAFNLGVTCKPEKSNDELYEQSIKREYSGLIVLDGPDCVGKTTLANALRDQLGANVVHRTWSKELEHTMDRYLMDPVNIFRKDDLLIIDRWALSEWIYSTVYRGGTQWKGFHRLAFQKLHQLGAINIVCCPKSFNQYIGHYGQEFSKREEMYSYEEDKLSLIWEYYNHSATGDLSFIGNGIRLNNMLRYDMFEENALEVMVKTIKIETNKG